MVVVELDDGARGKGRVDVPERVTLWTLAMVTLSAAAGEMDMLLNVAQALFRPSFTRSVLPCMNVVPRCR